MSGPPLVPSPVYGLRTWTVRGEHSGERLAGVYRDAAPWPAGGDWVDASCTKGHSAPAPGCSCGIHAWHPRLRAARRILAGRREIPGIVEATGAIEVHEDGFRAARARPHALLLTPGRNAALVRRLGEAYEVPVVEVTGPDDVLEWCRERGLGLGAAVVAGLLGADEIEAQLRARKARVRTNVLRVTAAVVVAALLLVLGLIATDPPGDRPLSGRAGEVRMR
jgi:hypothetical protein